MPSIEDHIARQLDGNQQRNLLYAGAGLIMDIEAGFRATLEKLVAQVQEGKVSPTLASEIAPFAAQALVDKLYAVNQYLRIDRDKLDELERIYQQTWETMLRTGDVTTSLREHHYPDLARWIAELYPQQFITGMADSPSVGQVVCAEYSAQFQLDLFGLELSQLKQPVLDIGCGSQAKLVHALRQQNVAAWGIDRALAVQAPWLAPVDWFDYPLEPRWGTILSNMAFTNHLVYVYRYAPEQIADYLRKFNAILDALLPGGSFVYAPGLPFIEERLDPTSFAVIRTQVVGQLCVSTITVL